MHAALQATHANFQARDLSHPSEHMRLRLNKTVCTALLADLEFIREAGSGRRRCSIIFLLSIMRKHVDSRSCRGGPRMTRHRLGCCCSTLLLLLLSGLQLTRAIELFAFETHQQFLPGHDVVQLNLTTQLHLLGQSYTGVTVCHRNNSA